MGFPLIQPNLQFFDDAGDPLSGGKLYVYEPTTSTPKTTYTDAGLGTANANPVVLDSAGRCSVYLTDGESYKFILKDSTDATTYFTKDNVKSPHALTAAQIGAALFPRTAAEIAAGKTPTNYEYEPGDVRRFGPALDGSTDDTTPLTNWAAVSGYHTFPLVATAKITAAIPMVSDSVFQFARGARIETSTQNISLFTATSKTRITIQGGHFKQTSAGNTATLAGVHLVSCSYCKVLDNEFEGMQWSGIFLDSCTQCDVERNYIHDSLDSTAGDKNDIAVYRNSASNTVRGNRCYGGLFSDHGILVQDPGGAGTYLPEHNKVVGNFIGDHAGYGIAVYIGGSQNSYNIVDGNTVQNVTGSYLSGDSGVGIYCVGAGLGGLQVTNNIVRNCCIDSTLTTLGKGAIVISGSATGNLRPVVAGNTIDTMTQGHGILIVSSLGGAVVTGNSVRMPSNNDGSGTGGATLAGDGIRIFNSSDVAVTGNIVLHNGSNDAFLANATDTNYDRITVTGNVFRAATGNALRFDRTSTNVYTDLTISGNEVRSDDAAAAIALVGCNRVSVTGNVGGANTGVAMSFTATTRARVSNNTINTNGSTGVSTSGTCTSSNYEKTNFVAGNISNGGTGFRIEQIGATPSAGTYVAGDTVWHTAPAAGASPGAICTTGGTPGTWKAMAAIAA